MEEGVSNRRGAGHKWEEEVKKELPNVRLSCQTTLRGPDGINSPERQSGNLATDTFCCRKRGQ
ncbi:hypothetical protein E2C01_048566 [Portunus trituberculatus]|uniref:Uncharacterized protein n=1 Tax=Portunus trituberculatus TaxID=210409 RepID=A0A5B7GBH5_PORTR|nr:hypothetical protein [Portunus trituberculatus]